MEAIRATAGGGFTGETDGLSAEVEDAAVGSLLVGRNRGRQTWTSDEVGNGGLSFQQQANGCLCLQGWRRMMVEKGLWASQCPQTLLHHHLSLVPAKHRVGGQKACAHTPPLVTSKSYSTKSYSLGMWVLSRMSSHSRSFAARGGPTQLGHLAS